MTAAHSDVRRGASVSARAVIVVTHSAIRMSMKEPSSSDRTAGISRIGFP